MKKRLVIAAVIAASAGALTACVAPQANAMARFLGDKNTDYYLNASETVDGSLYALGESVIIEGTVNGDVFCAGQRVELKGTVKGDVLCAAQKITITGAVDGNVRLAAEDVSLRSNIGKNATIFAQAVTAEANSVINGDLSGGAQTVQLAGKVGRDIQFGSERLVINGLVGRDVEGEFESITITNSATVGGKLTYTGAALQGEGKVIGGVTRLDSKPDQNGSKSVVAAFSFWILLLLSMLLAAMALAALVPRQLRAIAELKHNEPLWAALVGFLVVAFVPTVALLLALTGIGLLVAVVLMLAWLLLMALSGPVAAYYIGAHIVKNNRTVFMRVLVGCLVVLAVYLVPFINIIAMFAVAVFGTGLMLVYLYKRNVFAR